VGSPVVAHTPYAEVQRRQNLTYTVGPMMTFVIKRRTGKGCMAQRARLLTHSVL